jgi:hypothetical protein
LQVEHSLNQAAYTQWKYEHIRSISGQPPATVERYDRRTGKIYRSVRFYTRAVLKDLRARFYADRRKVVPPEIGEMLDAMALAVWFMDDGGRGARTPKGLVFNTSSFSVDEQVILQTVMAEKFGVQTSVHRTGRGFQLYVRAQSFDRFAGLISPYLISSMRYKLPVDPVTTSSGRTG